MVVLAVTWMAKMGRESDTAAILEKLTAESRKEPGCTMYQVHKHKTDPRRFFIYEHYLLGVTNSREKSSDWIAWDLSGKEKPIDGSIERELSSRTGEDKQDKIRVAPDSAHDRATINKISLAHK